MSITGGSDLIQDVPKLGEALVDSIMSSLNVQVIGGSVGVALALWWFGQVQYIPHALAGHYAGHVLAGVYCRMIPPKTISGTEIVGNAGN